MRKLWFREDEQPAQGRTAGRLAAEIWTWVSSLKFLDSLLFQSAFTEEDPSVQLVFLSTLWKLCTEFCIIEQVEAAHESWKVLFDIFGKGQYCTLCCKARFILFTCICYQSCTWGSKYVPYSQHMPWFLSLSFKSCPEAFIVVWSITHLNLQSPVFLMCPIRLWYQKLSFSLFFLEKFLHFLIFQLKWDTVLCSFFNYFP